MWTSQNIWTLTWKTYLNDEFLGLFITLWHFQTIWKQNRRFFTFRTFFWQRSQSPKGFKLFFDTKIHFHLQFHEFFALWEHSEAFTETLSPFFSKIVAFYTFHHVEYRSPAISHFWKVASDCFSKPFWTFLDTSITKIRFLHDNWTLPRPPKAVFKLFKGFKVQKFAI